MTCISTLNALPLNRLAAGPTLHPLPLGPNIMGGKWRMSSVCVCVCVRFWAPSREDKACYCLICIQERKCLHSFGCISLLPSVLRVKVQRNDTLCCIKEISGEVYRKVRLTVSKWYAWNATGSFAQPVLKYPKGFIKNSILVCFSFSGGHLCSWKD